MYSNNYYPDGLTERDIDLLIAEAFAPVDDTTAAPTSLLLDGQAARRRTRRLGRRVVNGTVRALQVHRPVPGPDGQEAA